jgi:hypothetical protein
VKWGSSIAAIIGACVVVMGCSTDEAANSRTVTRPRVDAAPEVEPLDALEVLLLATAGVPRCSNSNQLDVQPLSRLLALLGLASDQQLFCTAIDNDP